MDLQAIRTFCRAVETGNLTAAAKALHITKSVASRRIQSLEDDLGVRLLARTTKGVSPTDEGALFYERGQRILDDLEDAAQMVKCTEGNLVGNLRITAPRSFADIFLGAPLMDFMHRHPELKFEMNLTDERVDIIGGGYDLGLRITRELDDTSLIARKLADMRSHIVASPAYLEKYGTPKKPEDLRDHQSVFYSNVETAKHWRFGTSADSEGVRVKGRLTCNSGQMQMEAALAGLAIANLPRFYVHEALEVGQLVPLLEDFPRPPTTLYALYPEKRLLPLKVRALIDHLASWFGRDCHACNL
ncbi:LysR family transcriptional regulator [Kordiimonas aestuarii]|uniref:LysR family transcriptional regulator n=1 Tax=Kordiimonas aestuarii TaxID=1005925 RepID=UPI0021D0D027|nr:LysR family transcriptional regulator [Kordiimonas aestuarii]